MTRTKLALTLRVVAVAFAVASQCFGSSFAANDPPKWSASFNLDHAPLRLLIWVKQNAPTELVIRSGGKQIAYTESYVYFDGSRQPYLKVKGSNAYIAFVADPGAGDGEYASIWRISDRGHKLSQLGTFLYADLRKWFTRGEISEIRPAKYATNDMVRRFPRIFDDPFYRNKRFIVRYRFDTRSRLFRVQTIRIVLPSSIHHWSVRLPSQ